MQVMHLQAALPDFIIQIYFKILTIYADSMVKLML